MVPDEWSLIELAKSILRHRKTVAVSGIVVVLLGIVGVVLPRRTYTSTATFLPAESQQSSSSLLALASQFGVTLPQSQPGQSPQFYADLVQSDALLRRLVGAKFTFVAVSGFGPFTDTTTVTQTLVQALGYDTTSSDSARSAALAVRDVRDHVLDVQSNAETGVVEVDVTLDSPSLAAGVAKEVVRLVSVFDQNQRESQAAAERRFIEGRLGVVGQELDSTERRLEQFLESNRDFQNAPTLVVEHDRLVQDVDLKQQTLTTLAQAYEQARMQEVRDTPLITIVDAPMAPALPDKRHLVLKVLILCILAAGVGAFLSIGVDALSRTREAERASFAELGRLWGSTVDDVKRLLPGRRRRGG